MNIIVMNRTFVFAHFNKAASTLRIATPKTISILICKVFCLSVSLQTCVFYSLYASLRYRIIVIYVRNVKPPVIAQLFVTLPFYPSSSLNPHTNT